MHYDKPLENTCSRKVFCMFKMSKKFCNKGNPARHFEKIHGSILKRHNDKKDSVEKTLVWTVQRVSYAFLCKVWEKFKPKKSKKKQHTDPWHGRINFIKKTSRYDYLLESSILHKILTILVCNSIFNEITISLVPNLF